MASRCRRPLAHAGRCLPALRPLLAAGPVVTHSSQCYRGNWDLQHRHGDARLGRQHQVELECGGGGPLLYASRCLPAPRPWHDTRSGLSVLLLLYGRWPSGPFAGTPRHDGARAACSGGGSCHVQSATELKPSDLAADASGPCALLVGSVSGFTVHQGGSEPTALFCGLRNGLGGVFGFSCMRIRARAAPSLRLIITHILVEAVEVDAAMSVSPLVSTRAMIASSCQARRHPCRGIHPLSASHGVIAWQSLSVVCVRIESGLVRLPLSTSLTSYIPC